jgi:hypothetical protein
MSALDSGLGIERGWPDGLGSARRRGVSCDVPIISGHVDDGTEFHTARHDVIDALIRVLQSACSRRSAGLRRAT